MELSQSGLQQSNGLTVISFKCQLSDLGWKAFPVESAQFISGSKSGGFLQVTLSLINAEPLPPSHPDRLA